MRIVKVTLALLAFLILPGAVLGNCAWALEKAPGFALMNERGDVVSLDSLRDKIIVLEWTNPKCPFVKRHYAERTTQTLAERYAANGVVWLAINSTKDASIESNLDWHEQRSLSFSVLDDHTGNVGRAYGAKTTPHVFVINREGKIAYRGALDDDPGGDRDQKDRTNYVAMALDAILAGREPTKIETKPYGCSVKYAPEAENAATKDSNS